MHLQQQQKTSTKQMDHQTQLILIICGPSILDFSWNTFEDVCRSDHYPIILDNEEVIHELFPSQWTEENIQTIQKFMRTDNYSRKMASQKTSLKKKNRPWFD